MKLNIDPDWLLQMAEYEGDRVAIDPGSQQVDGVWWVFPPNGVMPEKL